MRLIFVLLVIAAGACKNATAQTPEDPLGPIRCFELVDAKNLSSQSGVTLCSAALSDAPGRCYVDGIDKLHQLSSQKLLSLCSRATSLGPLDCYMRLNTEGTLTEDQIVSYCTTRCAYGPAPAQVSDPGCVEGAIRAGLPLQKAGDLCTGSRSSGPVVCFIAGRDIHKLTDDDLIQLCTERTRCQYDSGQTPPP